MDMELLLTNEIEISREAAQHYEDQLVALCEKKAKQADITDLKGKVNFRKARIISPEYFAYKQGSDIYVYKLHADRHYFEVFLISKDMAKVLATV